MADDENKGEGTSRGNEWEVVSLTASTYEAAPGPKEFESTDDDKELNRTEEESSRAMFMSGHFVFPPSQHENLPLEPDISEIHDELRGEGPDSTEECGPDLAEGDGPKKPADDNRNIKELSEVDEQLGLQLFDEKGKRLSFPGTKLEEGKDFQLQGFDLLEEHSLYGAAKLSSFHAEADMSGSTAFDGSTIIPEDRDPTQNKLDSPLDSSKYQDTTKEDKSVPPCEAWWKKRAASLYSHAKEANTFWSVVVAAALMGLVILGQRWQQERWQLQQLKWKLGMNDEKINRMLGPISRFKDVLVGGHRRSPVIRSASAER
ncbi:hypothetical protein AAC387_Pa11g0189 [Persea americana]